MSIISPQNEFHFAVFFSFQKQTIFITENLEHKGKETRRIEIIYNSTNPEITIVEFPCIFFTACISLQHEDFKSSPR